MREIGELDHAIADAIEELRDVVGPMKKTVDTLATRDGLRVVARSALMEQGRREPRPEEIDAVIDGYLQRGFTASTAVHDYAASAAFASFKDGDKLEFKRGSESTWRTITWSTKAASPIAEQPTVDPSARFDAQARHLKNLDQRVKRIERGEP